MQYLLLLTFPPGEGPQEGTPEFDAEMQRWGELREAGAWLGASGLNPPEAVTTVRAERQPHGHRRPVRGDQGDPVLLHHDRRPRPRRRDRVGGEDAGRRVRLDGDLALAEDAVQDAFVAAAVEWERRGRPTGRAPG